jgi:peptidoglycan/xylan/chitin deacetylase (PgdA/CDA1 family)
MPRLQEQLKQDLLAFLTEHNMLTILAYHQIAQVPAEHDPSGLTVSPSSFAQQMAYLYTAGYQCLTLQDALYYWQTGRRPPRKSFVLTFDDGYEDVYTTVWPILERFGFTATIFLVASRVGSESTWKKRRGALATPLMSWTAVRQMQQAGFTFGNHTLTHAYLPTLDDRQVRDEITCAKAMLEDRLGTPVPFFCYPYNASDARIQQLVAESGHHAACSNDRGRWSFYNVWRVECTRHDTLQFFTWKVSRWHQRFIWLRQQPAVGRAAVRLVKTMYNKLRPASIITAAITTMLQ